MVPSSRKGLTPSGLRSSVLSRVKTVKRVTRRAGTILIQGIAYCIVAGQRLIQSMASRLFRRLCRALFTFPSWGGWLDTLSAILFYGCVAVVVGFSVGMLSLPLPEEISRETLVPAVLVKQLLPENFLTFAGTAFLAPALGEELIFRGLLVPRYEERLKRKWAWIAMALGLFVAWHPLNARYFSTESASLLTAPSFLCLACLLGICATWLYRRTGSIWSAVIFHWVVVLGWKFFGGSLPGFL